MRRKRIVCKTCFDDCFGDGIATRFISGELVDINIVFFIDVVFISEMDDFVNDI